MGRNLDPVCKLCRREGIKLYLKGSRCDTPKCAIDRRNVPPGMHGYRRGKPSEYGVRLREKQKVRRIYGIVERQFRRYFAEADRRRGVTGENLLALLEQRLDSVCFRLGFAPTRAEARQTVLHRHITVNGKSVNVPSYQVKPGDVVAVHERSRTQARILSALEQVERRGIPQWLDLDKAALAGTIKTAPNREEITLPIQEQLIVEFYSR
jgi:small subunit ribosomal protein S4